jgi:predicted site-specific integrase-resolvase
MMLTTKQAADRLGLKPGTLEAWRVRGGGPIYVKFGKAVRYPDQNLDAFEKGNERNNTSQAVGATR